MNEEMIQTRLLEHFPNAKINIQDLTGGGDHWQVEIVSTIFEGKSLIEQHQLVYKAMGSWMNKEIHALALNTSAS